jgi:hypothetical protein
LEYAICRFQENEELELNGTYQLVVYATADILDGNINKYHE